MTRLRLIRQLLRWQRTMRGGPLGGAIIQAAPKAALGRRPAVHSARVIADTRLLRAMLCGDGQ